MKSLLMFLLMVLVVQCAVSQPVYLATGGTCSFFSATPVENIDAHSTSMSSVLNTNTKELLFKVPISTFKFKKALMQEHFNEKYLESEKFPYAEFKGRLNESVDFSKDSTMQVTATGVLNMHGVDKSITETGTLTIKEGKIEISCDFKVAIKDYKITIPKIVVANIAEVVDVKLECIYSPYKKAGK